MVAAEAADEMLAVLFAEGAIAEDMESFVDELMLVMLDIAVIEEISDDGLSVAALSDAEVAAGVGGGETTLPADGCAVAVTLSGSNSTVEVLSDSGSTVATGCFSGASEGGHVSSS